MQDKTGAKPVKGIGVLWKFSGTAGEEAIVKTRTGKLALELVSVLAIAALVGWGAHAEASRPGTPQR
jgi:hypothetical protein